MNSNRKPINTKVMRNSAETLDRNIITGHDWPNTQDELDRINSARWLREAAATIDDLRGQRQVLEMLLGEASEVLHTLSGESVEEAQMLREIRDRIADARGAVWLQYAAES